MSPRSHHGDVVFIRAAFVAGLGFGLQATSSPVTDSHLAYHAVNSVLSIATAAALLWCARTRPDWVSSPARVMAWVGGVAGAVMGVADVTAVVADLAGHGEIGIVEGVAHTLVLLLILGLVVFGATLRAGARRPGLLLGVSALVLLVMVLVGLDQPEQFAVPELALGAAWVWLGFRVSR